MKKTVLYPFKREDIPYILSEEAIYGQYKITEVVAPRGSGLCGKDIAHADNREKTGIVVQENLEECLKKADALLITAGGSDEYNFGLDEAIRLAIVYKKDILCNAKLSVIKKRQVTRACKQGRATLIYGPKDKISWRESVFSGMYNLKVPVIFVASIYNDANNSEMMLRVNRKLRERGYNACMVGAIPELQMYDGVYCSVLNEIASGKLLDNNVAVTIKSLNHYFKCIENKMKPDLVLVQIPGGLIDTPLFPNESGVPAYIITRAIQADYVIGTILYGEYETEALFQINEEIDKRFGFRMNCVHVSNKMLHLSSSLQKMSMEFLYMPMKEMKSNISRVGNMLVGNYVIDAQEQTIVEDMIETLGEEG